jgi:hypothetical protein
MAAQPMTVVELRKKLKALGLSTVGNKADLAARLAPPPHPPPSPGLLARQPAPNPQPRVQRRSPSPSPSPIPVARVFRAQALSSRPRSPSSEPQGKIHKVGPELGPTLRIQKKRGICCQTAGLTCDFWANPVDFRFARGQSDVRDPNRAAIRAPAVAPRLLQPRAVASFRRRLAYFVWRITIGICRAASERVPNDSSVRPARLLQLRLQRQRRPGHGLPQPRAAGLLAQGAPGVPPDPLAPRRGSPPWALSREYSARTFGWTVRV